MRDDGERQIAPTLDGIRRDHVARYEWAARQLAGAAKLVDVACGIGYGSAILADAGFEVEAVERDAEAVAYGREHYARERLTFRQADAAQAGGAPVDAAVCFETIEHLADPAPMLLALRGRARRLLASVPNESAFPHNGQVLFHFRHYTKGQFRALLARTGWKVVQWWGQEGDQSELVRDLDGGRTLVAIAEAAEVDERPAVTPGHDALAGMPAPEHVALLGLGPSLEQYLNVVKRLGGKHAYCDETWGINAVGGVLQCDRVFHMDDVRIQEARAKALPESNIARMLEWLRVHPGPVITSRPHPDYPGLVAFPLREVLDKFQHDYFNSTAAYAVAYAIHIGVKKLSLFGLDFTYASSHQAEKGRACVEFWLGQASARGLKLVIAKTSSLMDACQSRADRLYGYDTVDVHLGYDARGRTTVEMTERDKAPTAEEIEERYDHSRHPNALVEASER